MVIIFLYTMQDRSILLFKYNSLCIGLLIFNTLRLYTQEKRTMVYTLKDMRQVVCLNRRIQASTSK
ncbi:uncharacterized protein FA14DRAFT_42092 [Meira miltonrushii]|uniref:Uncharacterized protein n=1 Tax=Meira miltonrushii TaxID=1280837 RepID=A0A316VCS2_9BASI|nr:uncharacterized protein FA14DRAFT_42092 [Meira miltonrushii]PWN35457.1 hypothetical protein FA14DRAFT_42092 [Meira miltonrushii]